MDTNRLKKFATEARNILIQGVTQRLLSLGYDTNGQIVQEPVRVGDGAIFLGDTVSADFYNRWQSMRQAIERTSVTDVVEEAAYTWFNRLTAIRIMARNGLLSPVLEYESDGACDEPSRTIHIPLLVSEARQGRMPEMDEYRRNKLSLILDDDSRTDEQFSLLIVAFCHATPVINRCFGTISDYTELLLPQNILAEGGFISMLNDTPFITDDDYKSPELIGWLYQFYISEKKDDVFASFKKGKKAEAEDIPAATQIFTPNWIVKYMVQNTVGRIYLDNNPYSEIKESLQYLVEPEETSPRGGQEGVLVFDDIYDLTCADLACGSGHILNECFDILYQLYLEEGYSRRKAIEDIFRYNLTGVDIDTRAKQLAQFALLLKACQKDSSFVDAHCMPKVLDMPKPYDAKAAGCSLKEACLKFIGGYENVIGEELEMDMELINDADTLGSIMKFSEDKDYLSMLQYHYDDWTSGDIDDCPAEIKALLPGVELILTLTRKYAALVMNPPYMGSGNMNAVLSKYVKEEYEEGKADLFSAFMILAIDRLATNGKYGMINMHSWMFLSSFEALRRTVIDEQKIDSLLHLGPRTFDELSGEVVQNAAFVITKTIGVAPLNDFMGLLDYFKSEYALGDSLNGVLPKHSGTYFRLVDGKNCADKERMYLEALEKHTEKVYYADVEQSNFEKIPGCPLGYWVSNKIKQTFTIGKPLGDILFCLQGIITGNTDKYLRKWYEIQFKNLSIHNSDFDSKRYWISYTKGGPFRKWYGNNEYVIYWVNGGNYLVRNRNTNSQYYLKPCFTWTLIGSNGFSVRYCDNGYLWDVSGSIGIPRDSIWKVQIGFMNCKLIDTFIKVLNPTINTNIEDVNALPTLFDNIISKEIIDKCVDNNISISRQDWDAHETSWDFQRNELLRYADGLIEDQDEASIKTEADLNRQSTSVLIDDQKTCGEHVESKDKKTLSEAFEIYKQVWESRFMQLHANEEELNRQFIEIYGLQDELTPDVPLDEITILQQGEISIVDSASSPTGQRIQWHPDVVMKQLISYAVGCMMGRYSIDKPGLILANQGDGLKEYNERVYGEANTTPRGGWEGVFEVDDDGIVPLMSAESEFTDNASKRFKTWLSVTFGEDTLVENLNFIEASLGKSIDDYFVKDFWKDHKKMYQNRPIYWLFSSRKGAFQCIAYMHRMNPYTPERIRTKYLLPHIEWLLNKQQELQDNAANLTTRERKELDNITKQIAECREYHDRLHIIADQQIPFDLDDGVLVNYAKFGDILAKLK